MSLKEEWKSIALIDGDEYSNEFKKHPEIEISNLGNCRIVDREGSIKEKSQTVNNDYKRIRIRKGIEVNVHRLVALLFLHDEFEKKRKNNPDDRIVVHHKVFDNNDMTLKLDNRASNLEWLTEKEHSIKHLKKSSY